MLWFHSAFIGRSLVRLQSALARVKHLALSRMVPCRPIAHAFGTYSCIRPEMRVRVLRFVERLAGGPGQ